MASNELKHHAGGQKWELAIQNCRVLSGIGRKDAGGHSGTAFVELRGPQPLENVSECIETLNIGGESIDLYQEMGPELLRTLVELLRR